MAIFIGKVKNDNINAITEKGPDMTKRDLQDVL